MEETLRRYKTHFLNQRFTEKSWHEYERNLIQLISWLYDNEIESLDAVTPEVLVKYGEFLRESTTIHRNTPISEKFYLQKLGSIRGFFKYLVDLEHLASNPALIAFPDLTPKHEKLARFLTPEELNEVIDNVSDPMELAVAYTLLSTGIRASELLSCNLHSLSLERKELRVIGKGGAERMTLLTDNDVGILRHYLLWRNPRAQDEALFISKRGVRLTYNQLHYIFAKIAKKTNIKLHPHLFRHTFATYMLEGGSNIKEVQTLLGHKRIDTTSRYTHITESMREKHGSIITSLQEKPSDSKQNSADKASKRKPKRKLLS